MYTQGHLVPSAEKVVYNNTHFLEGYQYELVSTPEGKALFEKDSAGIETFEQIYQCYWQFVAQRIRRVLSGHYSSYIEDLAQETFLKAYRAFQEGKRLPCVAIASWLTRIATNVTIDMLRKQRSATLTPLTVNKHPYGGQDVDLVDEVQWSGSDDGGSFEQRLATREAIERALCRMPRKSALCLWYYTYNGFSCAEIANILHMDVAAVRVRLMRARIHFIKLYHKETLSPKSAG